MARALGQAIGSVFHAIASVVVGGLNWTVGVAAKFRLSIEQIRAASEVSLIERDLGGALDWVGAAVDDITLPGLAEDGPVEISLCRRRWKDVSVSYQA